MAEEKNKIGRRKAIKALAGVPVLGALGFEILKKAKYDQSNNLKKSIIKELGYDDILSQLRQIPDSSKGDLIRIGMVGFGSRGLFLAKSLGFLNPEIFSRPGIVESLAAQIQFGNLNVALTGICDVYDQHAENGLMAAQHDIHTQGEFAKKHPVKRYLRYHDMLADKNIDAIVIATPDHHHAQMSIDAIKAGKHVYCEKSPALKEDEINELYDVVKNSNLVFQLGHQIPQNNVFQQAKEIVNRGVLGKISHIETSTNRNTRQGAWLRAVDENNNPRPGDEKSIDWKQWLGPLPYHPFSLERFYGWARFLDYDTGLLGQLFSHEFDAINQMLDIGIPSSVVASGGQYFYKDYGDIPDVINCIFEYPNKELTLTYSANLASSKSRPRTIYGKDAYMTFGGDIDFIPDVNSEKFAEQIKNGKVNPSTPMISVRNRNQENDAVDGVTSATSKYYASRGLSTTFISGQEWDVTHLHMKEWVNCIRNGGETSANIDKAYSEGVAIIMANISYREKCRTEWDPKTRTIKRC